MARAQRHASVRARDGDFSNVGQIGRRTGLQLKPQSIDDDGLERVDSLFSSPKKPSPLKQVYTAEEFEDQPPPSIRPTPRASIPRSASPRKSGISGAARRSTGGFRAVNQSDPDESDEAEDEAPVSSPSRANRGVRLRSSSVREASPLRELVNESTRSSAGKRKSVMQSIENTYQGSDVEDQEPQPFIDDGAVEIDDYRGEADEDVEEEVPVQEPVDDLDADETFTLRDGKTAANSHKKRKSDGDPAQRPAKKAKSKAFNRKKSKKTTVDAEDDESVPARRGRPPLKAKGKNTKTSDRQQKEVDDFVEHVKAKPGPPRSLYILRKETPADPHVQLTRSGRMTVKPLAYWRNERCVWGGSPNTALKEGTRFPMNSIKEIIRTEEHNSPAVKKKSSRKGKRKAKNAASEVDEESSDEEATSVEPWEVESGTVRGSVSEWDNLQALPLATEQEIEIAHSSQAIQTYVPQPKNGQEPAQFRYSRLFSNSFMSVGLVDLPPGGVKKPKNSQKMQMTFYVLKGRVTVSVGPILGEMTTFGIGKGGFWQVPRGNQYAIENEHGTEARLVFCQGCMVNIEDEEE